MQTILQATNIVNKIGKPPIMAADYLFLFGHLRRGNYSRGVSKRVTASLPAPCSKPFTLKGAPTATYSVPGVRFVVHGLGFEV